MQELKQGTEIIYIGGKHSVLQQGESYKVFSVSEGGVQVYIKTGFCGLTNDKFKIKG